MNKIIESYNEIMKYVGKSIYRICPKCNENHNGSCKFCAWGNSMSDNGCNIYGLSDKFPKEMSQVIEFKLTWNYMPNFIENLGVKTFLSQEEAINELKK